MKALDELALIRRRSAVRAALIALLAAAFSRTAICAGAEEGPATKPSQPVKVPFDGRYFVLRGDGVWSFDKEGAAGKSATRTDLPDAKLNRVAFVVYGDNRNNPEVHAGLAKRFAAHKAAFVLHTGDFVGNGEAYDEWAPQFFTPLKGVIDKIPFALVRGNHEALPPYFEAFFMPPEAKPYYAFRWGPVMVVSVDCGRPERSEEFAKWLDETMAQAKDVPWKLFAKHVPLVSTENEGSFDERGLGKLGLALERGGTDIVFSGHDHLYSRSAPLASEEGAKGMVFITTGGGGAPLYEGGKHAWVEAYAKQHHYCVIEATASKLDFKALDADGKVFDSFILDKEKPSKGASWKKYFKTAQ